MAKRNGSLTASNLLVLTALSAIAASPPATAAVRLCRQETAAEATAANDKDARRQALADWTAHVKSSEGVGYTRWELAWNRRLACARAAGSVTCTATARACTLSQVPPSAAEAQKQGQFVLPAPSPSSNPWPYGPRYRWQRWWNRY